MRPKATLLVLMLLAGCHVLGAGCATPTPPVTPTPTMTTPQTTIPVTRTPVTTVPATTLPQTTVPATTEPATPTVTATMTPPGAVTVGLVAKNIVFNTSLITVPACSNVTINFENQDAGVPHNFALYTDSSGATNLYRGQIITGSSIITYTFTAPCSPGDYHFRCDPHAHTMFGTFRVF